MIRCAGKNRCPAGAAEGVPAQGTAFGCLEVALWHAGQKHETGRIDGNRGAKRGAGEHLAIGAMADLQRGRVNLRREGDLPAMTASVDFHGAAPGICLMQHLGKFRSTTVLRASLDSVISRCFSRAFSSIRARISRACGPAGAQGPANPSRREAVMFVIIGRWPVRVVLTHAAMCFVQGA